MLLVSGVAWYLNSQVREGESVTFLTGICPTDAPCPDLNISHQPLVCTLLLQAAMHRVAYEELVASSHDKQTQAGCGLGNAFTQASW